MCLWDYGNEFVCILYIFRCIKIQIKYDIYCIYNCYQLAAEHIHPLFLTTSSVCAKSIHTIGFNQGEYEQFCIFIVTAWTSAQIILVDTWCKTVLGCHCIISCEYEQFKVLNYIFWFINQRHAQWRQWLFECDVLFWI